MGRDKTKNTETPLDEELETLWREGIDDGQFDRICSFIAEGAQVSIPSDLKARLLRTPDSVAEKYAEKPSYGFSFPLRYVPATLVLTTLIIGSYYMGSRPIPFLNQPSSQAGTKADQFLRGIIEPDFSSDIFDEDLSVLEHLS